MTQIKKKENNNYGTLYIVRHGETDWNRDKLLQGHKGVGLNSTGISQAEAASKFFNELEIDAIYTSDLPRATETADLLYKKHTHKEVTSKLRERDYGKFEGRTLENIRAEHFPESLHMSISEFWPQLENNSEVEGYDKITERIMPYIEEIATKHKRQNVLLVTHAGILRAILVYLGYTTYPKLLRRGVMDNLAHIEIESDKKGLKVKTTKGINLED